MKKIVVIDSQIFIWGIKRKASPGQEHKIPQAIRFIQQLDNDDIKILLPTPVIIELLSQFDNEGQKNAVIKLTQTNRILVKPLDLPSSLKCSELLFKTFNNEELNKYREDHKIPKAKIKYDAMIASIGIVNKCECIYSDDGDIERFAHGQIKVLPMPSYSIQQDLFTDKPATLPESSIEEEPF